MEFIEFTQNEQNAFFSLSWQSKSAEIVEIFRISSHNLAQLEIIHLEVQNRYTLLCFVTNSIDFLLISIL